MKLKLTGILLFVGVSKVQGLQIRQDVEIIIMSSLEIHNALTKAKMTSCGR